MKEIGPISRAQDTACGVLTIDVGAIARNYDALKTRLGTTATGAVVKADAYGLGARRIVPTLYGHGCRDFFVAHLGEALELRDSLPASSF